MKWAEVPAAEDQAALLIWALTFAIEDPAHSMNENIIDMFSCDGEIGGDPGWGIQHYFDDEGNDQFDVWVDPRLSGLKGQERTYSADIVRSVTRKLLGAFSEAHPDKRNQVNQLLLLCNL